MVGIICIMHGWHYISMHNSLNIFWFWQKLSWRWGRGYCLWTHFLIRLYVPDCVQAFSLKKGKVKQGFIYENAQKKVLENCNFVLKSPWFCSTKKCMNAVTSTRLILFPLIIPSPTMLRRDVVMLPSFRNILVNTLESTSFNGFWPNLVHT
jgi:hypothetical protein